MILNGISARCAAHVTDDTVVRHHCDHDDGRTISLVVEGERAGWDTPTLYLVGTPDDLRRFADRIAAAATLARVAEPVVS